MLSIAIVCEGPADQRTGCDLADRIFCNVAEWLDSEALGYQRQWRGFELPETYLSWAMVKKLADRHNVRSHGFFDEKPAVHDAHAATKALRLLLEHSQEPPDAVILLRDQDDDPSRREGLQQARCRSILKDRIVIGVAVPMRESWVLAGFEPQDDEERGRLKTLQRELGFDPRERAEQLTAAPEAAKKSAKRVLDVLTSGDRQREADCWKKTALGTLKDRGERTGLADYIKEVKTRLVPLLTPLRWSS